MLTVLVVSSLKKTVNFIFINYNVNLLFSSGNSLSVQFIGLGAAVLVYISIDRPAER